MEAIACLFLVDGCSGKRTSECNCFRDRRVGMRRGCEEKDYSAVSCTASLLGSDKRAHYPVNNPCLNHEYAIDAKVEYHAVLEKRIWGVDGGRRVFLSRGGERSPHYAYRGLCKVKYNNTLVQAAWISLR